MAIEYRAVGLLPLSFATHTNSEGLFRLNLPPGTYRVIIAGCKSWPFESTNPPRTMVPRVTIDPDRVSYDSVIYADGTCSAGAVAL